MIHLAVCADGNERELGRAQKAGEVLAEVLVERVHGQVCCHQILRDAVVLIECRHSARYT